MKLAIMQPYFLPYIGYFQLMAAADTFMVYDNIKYTKKGWINRNRFLQNGTDAMFSLPLKSGSDALDIDQRMLAEDNDPRDLLKKLRGAYQRAPYFTETQALLERIVSFEGKNLFAFLHHSLVQVAEHLSIKTPIVISSSIAGGRGLKGQERVLSLCETVGCDTYINAIGGVELYEKAAFAAKGIDLKFVQSKPFTYSQFGAPFVPWLSIVDVLMFNSVTAVQDVIRTGYELV